MAKAKGPGTARSRTGRRARSAPTGRLYGIASIRRRRMTFGEVPPNAAMSDLAAFVETLLENEFPSESDLHVGLGGDVRAGGHILPLDALSEARRQIESELRRLVRQGGGDTRIELAGVATIVLSVAENRATVDAKLQSFESEREQGLRQRVREDQSGESATLREAMERIAPRLPVAYDARRAALAAITDEFREQVGIALQGSLNARLAEIPHETHEEKKALVLWLNAEMRRFGLAIRCPKTGRASLLQADHGRFPEQGRFQLDNVDDEGIRHRTLSFNELIPLELMPDDLSRAAWGKWAGHSQPGPRRRSPGG